MPAVRPSVVPFHSPDVAMSTAPGGPRPGVPAAEAVFGRGEGISGAAHQVAVRSVTPLSCAETICQGGTFSADGFEITSTPLDSVPRHVFAARLLAQVDHQRLDVGRPAVLHDLLMAGSVATLALAALAAP